MDIGDLLQLFAELFLFILTPWALIIAFGAAGSTFTVLTATTALPQLWVAAGSVVVGVVVAKIVYLLLGWT